jgi:predicted nucleic acid-binding protein
VILADSSAWVEFLRATERPAHRTLRRLLATGAEIAVTEPVVMELLAGIGSPREEDAVRGQLTGFALLSVGGIDAYEHAAEIYRSCRRGGETVRRMLDCLIAVPAIRAGAAILHADRDFDVIARHTSLEVVPLDA